MKKRIVSLGIIVAFVAILFAFITPQSAIVGSVSPADGAEGVWAVGATDSVRGTILNTGSFSLVVKPGIYKLVVDAKSPYKDVVLPNLEVKQDQPLDIGEIVLQQ